ncbi:MAG: class I SAM-dependent methyltransferase [Pirellulaceae bacterium]|jgi:tocopherol O-methyltransferase|nr:class I SAM-dependent methyltransferase [Pirellulaceae bacterium]MDP7016525.1 class I SAM-dependent methyltransferase [Pirellulaceae bacterium]
MITPRKTTTADDVAGHYNDLDHFYRRLWGDHVHHGLWRTGRESPEVAVTQLIEHVVEPLEIEAGDRICDVGCGYGGTSRFLVNSRGARMTGLTVSAAQHQYAVDQTTDGENPNYLLENWETNSLPDESFDAVLSIECLSHIEHKELFFQQIHRVLKPGGRAVVVAWLAAADSTPWQQRHLLEPICREGRLPGMGSTAEYSQMIAAAGLQLTDFEELSEQVKKTWTVCSRRVLGHVLTSPATWWFLLSGRSSHAVFLVTLARLWEAYRSGAMEYGMFVMQRPSSENSGDGSLCENRS